jgi:serine/threonine-protein kinase
VVSLGPPLVTVPDLTNTSETDATNRLIGAGLQKGNVTHRYDDNAPKGNVLSWSGQGGQLPKGSPVDLVISDGPPTVPVPSSVVGGSFSSAQSALAAVNLSAVENDVFSNIVPKGQVIGTTPPPGTAVHVGSEVTVTVSKGPDLVAVPDVRGQTIDAATQALQNSGLSVSGVTGPASPSSKVTVTHTAPAAGAQVLRGSSVQLITN